jgi:glucose-1-phosphate cytidylyltransferase
MGGDAAVPKPMTPIGGRPIIEHLIRYLAGQGIDEFVIAAGHATSLIDEHFTNADLPCKIRLANTGIGTGSGSRLRRIAPYLGPDPFIFTYCDGLYDADIGELLGFHRARDRIATVASIHPRCRFGILDLDGDRVAAMREKPLMTDLWVNAGLFVLEPGIFEYIADDCTSWEADVMPAVASAGQLSAWHHNGFWQCMDTPAEAALLNSLWLAGAAPWATGE